jgi:uncharacterized membrane protein
MFPDGREQYMHQGGGHWLLMVLGFVIVVSVIALAIIAVIHYSKGGGALGSKTTKSISAAGPSPQDVLSLRLANGEIDVEEYRSRLTALNGG